MADIQITFTVKDSIKDELIEMVSARHPVPTDQDGSPLFSPAQWAKEYYRRLWKRELKAYRKEKAQASALPVNEDDVS